MITRRNSMVIIRIEMIDIRNLVDTHSIRLMEDSIQDLMILINPVVNSINPIGLIQKVTTRKRNLIHLKSHHLAIHPSKVGKDIHHIEESLHSVETRSPLIVVDTSTKLVKINHKELPRREHSIPEERTSTAVDNKSIICMR